MAPTKSKTAKRGLRHEKFLLLFVALLLCQIVFTYSQRRLFSSAENGPSSVTPSLEHSLAAPQRKAPQSHADNATTQLESVNKVHPTTIRNDSSNGSNPILLLPTLTAAPPAKVVASREHNLVAPKIATRYAIMWIIGGIHEDRPSYKGFLYNVLISARLLEQQGSTSDLILWAQLSPDSKRTTLEAEDLRLLHACHVQVRYLEKDDEFESFGLLVYAKFHAIKMVEYKRVMFLDADLIPTVNMDYLFHLSDAAHAATATILRPNLIMATRGEPCNTAFFVVEPNLERYNLLQMAIERQHKAGTQIPYPHFSYSDGWGHNFRKAGDAWKAVRKTNVQWRYHASHSDQGLMYYYAKYLIQDTSIAIGDTLEHWGPQTDGSNEGKDYRLTLPKFLSVENGTLTEHSPNPFVWQNTCDQKPGGNWQCPAPYRNLAHFSGNSKPWAIGHKGFAPTKSTGGQDAAYRLWFRTLAELSQELSMGLDVENWNTKHMPQLKDPPLGYIATWLDLEQQVYNRTLGG